METNNYILSEGYRLKSDSRTYTIERKLGQGGFGITYLASFTQQVRAEVAGNLSSFDEEAEQQISVVIKEFYIREISSRDERTAMVTFGSSSGQGRFVEAFKQKMRKEAGFLSRLHHPNIARVSEIFEANNTVYIVMQYIRGESLLDRISRLKKIPTDDAVRYTAQICDALEEVHRHNILHLDVKPGNILLDKQDNARLIDFGVSKQYDDKNEETSHSVLGKSDGYAPMEQYAESGLKVFRPPTDIYALGATLYCMLTGIKPIPAPDRMHTDLDAPSDLDPSIPRALSDVVMKAMDVYVRNRYQSAAAFKAAIESTIPEITKAEPGPQSDKKKPKADRKTAIIAGVITGVITGLLASFILIYVFSSKDDPIQTEPQDTSVLIGPPQDTAALIRPPENTPATQNTSVSTRPQENKPAQQNTPVSTKPPANKPTVQNTAVLTKPPENKPATQDTLPQDTASLTKPPENKPEPQDKFVSIDIPLVYVSGGTFTMGCTAEQGKDCTKNEKPEHEVTVDGFYIGKYEVTQAQWKAVTGSNPSKFKGDNLPVVVVSWDDIVGTSGDYMTINSIKYYANGFIYKLNKLTGKQYRLPTEAEWEYAARGGADSQGYKYSGSNTLSNVAWYEDNSDHKTHPVGTKSANELGIYDMSGNVCEWCSDWYGKYSYSYNSQTNPTGPATGSRRVIRGGGLAHKGRSCRVSNREYLSPGFRVNYLGFRLACSSNEIITKTFFI